MQAILPAVMALKTTYLFKWVGLFNEKFCCLEMKKYE